VLGVPKTVLSLRMMKAEVQWAVDEAG